LQMGEADSSMAERIPLKPQGIRSTKARLLHLQGVCSPQVNACPLRVAAFTTSVTGPRRTIGSVLKRRVTEDRAAREHRSWKIGRRGNTGCVKIRAPEHGVTEERGRNTGVTEERGPEHWVAEERGPEHWVAEDTGAGTPGRGRPGAGTPGRGRPGPRKPGSSKARAERPHDGQGGLWRRPNRRGSGCRRDRKGRGQRDDHPYCPFPNIHSSSDHRCAD
jgi:hypothetical protein